MIIFVGTALADVYLKNVSLSDEHEALYAYSNHKVYPGGKLSNQAICASRFGSKAFLFARIGIDENGNLIQRTLEKENVETKYLTRDQVYPTGFVVLVPQEKDSISAVVSYGAGYHLNNSDIKDFKTLIKEASVLVIGLEIDPAITNHILNIAAQNKTPVILDPYPPNRADTSFLLNATIITPNRVEGSIISGRSIDSVFSAKLAVKDILSTGVNSVCLKLGKDGVIVGYNRKIHFIPPVDIDPVDATSGGDVFAGILARCMEKNVNLKKAVELANYASALSVTKPGSYTSIPKPKELIEFLIHRRAGKDLVNVVKEITKNQ